MTPVDPEEHAGPRTPGGPDKRAWRSTLRRDRRRRPLPTPSGIAQAAEADELSRWAPDLLRIARARHGKPMRVAAFHPTPDEPDLVPLLHTLHARIGAALLFPLDGGADLDWAGWDGDAASFHPSPGRGFGMEPDGEHLGPRALAHTDLVLAPALAVDRSGTRLGHGRGLYDRALQHLPAGVPVLAVVHPREVLSAHTLPREAHDHPVDGALTTAGPELFGPGRNRP